MSSQTSLDRDIETAHRVASSLVSGSVQTALRVRGTLSSPWRWPERPKDARGDRRSSIRTIQNGSMARQIKAGCKSPCLLRREGTAGRNHPTQTV